MQKQVQVLSRYLFPGNCQIPRLAEFYHALFGFRRNGFFVEIGAYDGENFSNTSGLADAGWHGIYVEPVPNFAELCRRRHSRNKHVRIVTAAVSDYLGFGDIFLGETLTTLSSAQVRDYQNIDWAAGLHSGQSMKVGIITLDYLLRSHSVKKNFDVLVVDVEGAEHEVFSKFCLSNWRPKIVIVELEDFHPDFACNDRIVGAASSIRHKLKSHGYTTAFRDHINSIFIRRDVLSSPFLRKGREFDKSLGWHVSM